MLYIDKSGDARPEDVLSAHNSLIPQGSELITTIMLEIDEATHRAAVLSRLGGNENRAFLDVAGERIETSGTQVVVGFDHSNCTHMAVRPEPVRAALSEDFD